MKSYPIDLTKIQMSEFSYSSDDGANVPIFVIHKKVQFETLLLLEQLKSEWFLNFLKNFYKGFSLGFESPMHFDSLRRLWHKYASNIFCSVLALC